MKLSKLQIETISKLLKEGKFLPEDYKNMLFPVTKKEYELIYADKEREEDILAETMAVPLQPVKTFGENGKDWTNKLIFGDNLQVVKTLLRDFEIKGKVKLIYIDPPFSTKRDFKGSQDQKAYQDKVAGAKFLEFLRKRLVFLREILAEDGSIYVHLDQRKGHYIKVLMDEIFGEQSFRNEIIWKRSAGHSDAMQFGRVHDSIYLYTKSTSYSFIPQEPYERENGSLERAYPLIDKAGRRYVLDNMAAAGSGEARIFGGKKITPPPGQHWRFSQENIDKLWAKGLIILNKSGIPRVKKYADERERMPVQDVWTDCIMHIYTVTGYPTEKSEKLLERIIRASSKEGDIILDAFSGSGTTLAVAERLGRKWIGIDCGKLAIYVTQKRLMRLFVKDNKKQIKPFTLYNAGLYDYQKVKKLPWEEYRSFALKLFQCRDEKHVISKIDLDGYLGDSNVLVFNYQKHKDVVLDRGFIEDLHSSLGDKIGDKFFVISPAANVKFLEDYIEKDKIKYYVLRIPYSIINELHQKDFQAINQPIDEMDVNNTVEAVGFDFIQIPEVQCEYFLDKPTKKRISSRECIIKIRKFESQIISKKPLDFKNRETLSMVMLDYDYNGKVFDIDDVFYAETLQDKEWEVRFAKDKIKKEMMIIYVDIFGNEKREVKKLSDFMAKK